MERSGMQTLHLGLELLRGEVDAENVGAPGLDDDRPSNGDPSGDAHALQDLHLGLRHSALLIEAVGDQGGDGAQGLLFIRTLAAKDDLTPLTSREKENAQ